MNAHKTANTMTRPSNIRVVCTRSGLGMLVNMRWNMMPALENRLGRFLYFEHRRRRSEVPGCLILSGGKVDSISSYCLESGWFVNFAGLRGLAKNTPAV